MTKLVLKYITLIALLLVVISCAPNKGSKNGSRPKDQLTQPNNEQVMSSNYYDQFTFLTYGNCNDINTVFFRAVDSWDPIYITSDSNGRHIYASLSLQLFPNGKYWAVYSENYLNYTREIGFYYTNKYLKEFRGNWAVNSSLLKIEGLGYGKPATYYNKATGKENKSFSVYLNSTIPQSGTIYVGLKMALTTSNAGPNGISVNEYCKLK